MLIYGPSNCFDGAEVGDVFWTLRQGSRSLARDLRPGHHNYEVKELNTRPCRSLSSLRIA